MSDNIGRPLSEAAAALLPYKTARELLAEKPPGLIAVAPQDSVLSALGLLAEHNFGLLVVLEGTRLVGVMSERDYARKIILKGRSSKKTKVEEIMISPPLTISPGCSVDEAMRIMTEHRVRHLPVVDDAATVLGIVSIGDLVKWIITSHEKTIEQLESYISGQS